MFTAADFAVFEIPGLEARMEGIKGLVRPKLEEAGRLLAPELARLTGHPMYPHVAKHARRKVNPPADTWVAWGANPRGYKMVPHFQLGLWADHLFLQAGVIYEAPAKALVGQRLPLAVPDLPARFYWKDDYTKPAGKAHGEMTAADFSRLGERLQTRKDADCMAGLRLEKADVTAMAPEQLLELAVGVFETLLPVYRLALP